MAVPPSNPNPNPNPNPNTTRAPLTSAQSQNLRDLLQFLHSTGPTTANEPRTSNPLPARPAAATATATPRPVSFQPLPTHQQTITIDASTRIMGHGNQVAVASLSSTEQQVAMIKEFFGGALQTQGGNKENATADMRANRNLNVIIHAGVNLIGSRNFVAVDGNRNGNQREVCNKDYVDNSSIINNNNNKVQNAPPPSHSAAERKRRAESEPLISHHQTTLSQKKVKVEE